jgi:predicted neutral ceramidase superfamily lipid hydrolase
MSASTKIGGRGLILKALPTQYSLLILIVEACSLSLIEYFNHAITLLFGLIPALLLNPLIAKLVINNKNFTLKRAFYIYVYLNTPLILILSTNYLTHKPSVATDIIYIISINVISYLLGLVLMGAFKATFAGVGTLLSVFMATYYIFTYIRLSFYIIVMGFLITLLSIVYVRRRLLDLKIGSVNGLELINSFALSWMDRSSHAFDDVCSKLGETKMLSISIHEFIANNKRIATLIIPYIHPGPAKSIGSGELPSIIFDKLKDYNPLVLHGASNHGLNLASRTDTEKITEHLIHALEENKESYVSLNKIGCGEFGARGIILTRYMIHDYELIFTSKQDSTEDLPKIITDMVDKQVDIIDRHNTLCDHSTAQYDHNEIELLKNLIEDRDKLSKIEWIEVRTVGYGNYSLDAKDVGPGGVRTITFYGSKKVAIVGIDANNLSCGLNKKIENNAKSLGYDYCEVTTTDNHWNSGATRKEPGYYLGGSISEQEIIASVRKCLIMAEKNQAKPDYRKTLINFETRVFGNRLEEMYLALKKGRRLIFVGGLLSALVSLAIILAIIFI